MIRRSEEIGERRVMNARGGDGEVVFHDWLLADDARGHGRLFSKIVIPEGASIGYHEHKSEFETFYVISGEATINDNGTEVVLREGDMHTCTDGSGHGVRNNGTGDLVLIALILNTLNVD